MHYFKDENSALYALSDEDIERGGSELLPDSCIAISDAEADAIRAASTTPPAPVSAEPVRIACALRVPVVNDEVQAVSGSYRVAAMLYQDVGTFLAIFSQNLGNAVPFVIPNNGVSVSIAEWGGDYAVIEVRDHADGNLITPASFGFSLFNF